MSINSQQSQRSINSMPFSLDFARSHIRPEPVFALWAIGGRKAQIPTGKNSRNASKHHYFMGFFRLKLRTFQPNFRCHSVESSNFRMRWIIIIIAFIPTLFTRDCLLFNTFDFDRGIYLRFSAKLRQKHFKQSHEHSNCSKSCANHTLTTSSLRIATLFRVANVQ